MELTEFSFLTSNNLLSLDFTPPEMAEALLLRGEKRHHKKHDEVAIDKDEIVIVLSGQILITPDFEGSPALGHALQYLPLGIIEKHDTGIRFSYQAEKKSTTLRLSYQDFLSVLQNCAGGTEYLLQLFSFVTSALVHINYERGSGTSYHTVRSLIYRYRYTYLQYPQNPESLSSFILKRSCLSRSYVFQILSKLKDGNFITLENGRLVSINKLIPTRY